ncbi:hypothetical protein ABZ835_19320 [Streptomyces sp. NPDC047461]|uniref:hypothetical protein n=1 Tax=Streptomyces sp. NPDC047461 TaxID=3155619 RepID=UPI0033FBD754
MDRVEVVATLPLAALKMAGLCLPAVMGAGLYDCRTFTSLRRSSGPGGGERQAPHNPVTLVRGTRTSTRCS